MSINGIAKRTLKGLRSGAVSSSAALLVSFALLLSAALLPATTGASAVQTAQSARAQAARAKDSRNKQYNSARKAVRSGDYEKAAKIYREILELDPQDIQAHLGIAYTYFKDLNYQLCFNHTSEALKIDPKSSRAHALAGIAMLRSGYIDHAMQQIVEAVKINSKEALAYGAAAEIDYLEGRSKDARIKALQAISLDSDEPDYLMTLGRASSRLELFNEAADAYERFLQVAPRTDDERRDRIEGLIKFYRQLSGLEIHEINGPHLAEVPFQLGNDRRPYIQIKVNGKPATFVIDTGSGFTVISKEAAKKFGVSEIARGGTSQGVGGTGKFEIVYGLVKNIQLGAVKVKSIPCFIRSIHGMSERPVQEQADGFIGLSVLAHFITELDYKDRVMRLDRSHEIPVAEGAAPAPVEDTTGVTIIPFRTTQNGLISIETELDGNHRINAILDSGASSTVVSAAAVERLNLHNSIIKGQTVRVTGAAGVTDNVELLFLRNCRVADLQQNNMRALVLDFDAINETSGFEQSGILGGDFLRNFRVTIDFTRAQVAFRPHTNAVIKQD